MTNLDEELQATVNELADTRKPRSAPHAVVTPRVEDDTGYDFEKLGETIAASLIQAAQAHVNNANVMLEQVQNFADDIRAAVSEKNKELADMNDRLKQFGDTLLEAHAKFNGGEPKS